jgi:hypothetical protein
MQPRKRTVGGRVPLGAENRDASVTDAIADARCDAALCSA